MTDDPAAGAGPQRRSPPRRAAIIVGALALLAPLAAAEVGARALEERLPEPSVWGTPELPHKLALAPAEGADVLVVGTSVTDAGLDPSQLDELLDTQRPSFNGSLGAGSLPMVSFTTRHIWLPRLRPTVVVIGVISRDFNPNDPRQRATQREFFSAPEIERLAGTEDIVERVDRWFTSTSVLWRHRSDLRSWTAIRGDAPPRWAPSQTDPDGQYLAFVDGQYQPSERLFEFVRSGGLADWELGADRVGALESLIVSAQATGARVLLVDMPTAADLVDIHPRGAADVNAYRATVDDLARRLDIELVRPPQLGDELFADLVHVNAAGAAELTRLVAEALATDAGSPA